MLGPGCHRSAVKRGLFRAHYERLRRDGDVRADVPLRPRSEERRLCAADGCDRPSQARGMCQSHYNSWRQSGILPPGVPDVGELPGGPCEVEGCDSPAIGWGCARATTAGYDTAGTCRQRYRCGVGVSCLDSGLAIGLPGLARRRLLLIGGGAVCGPMTPTIRWGRGIGRRCC